MTDLRVRYGLILALALFPILLFSIYMAFSDGRIMLVIVSILAWVFGYFSLWITTDKLVFSHLRKIRAASDDFAAGNMDARVETLDDAPDRITALAMAFNVMADRISERETRLLDNLDEKEILLREIHHRVKNNLQIIISLLNIQERKLDDPQGLAAIRETRARINAIALVHRGLYEGEDLRVINMPVFLDRLIEELKTGLGNDDKDVTTTLNIQPVNFEPDTAIPVALFIVEALTNALKHGVTHGGTVQIDLTENSGDVIVSVQDDGVGVSASAANGTGLKLIKGFARQLSGQWKIDDVDKGYKVSLRFSA